jgi:hypothetical protein
MVMVVVIVLVVVVLVAVVVVVVVPRILYCTIAPHSEGTKHSFQMLFTYNPKYPAIVQ